MPSRLRYSAFVRRKASRTIGWTSHFADARSNWLYSLLGAQFIFLRAIMTAPAKAFVGFWRLVSYESRDTAGTVAYPLGHGTVGLLAYDDLGNMSAMLMKPDRPAFVSSDPHRGTDAEVRAAFEGFAGYFGTYTVDPGNGTVTHHVRAASFPNWVDGDQVRFYKFDGARLVLSTPPMQVGGRSLTWVLVWERVS